MRFRSLITGRLFILNLETASKRKRNRSKKVMWRVSNRVGRDYRPNALPPELTGQLFSIGLSRTLYVLSTQRHLQVGQGTGIVKTSPVLSVSLYRPSLSMTSTSRPSFSFHFYLGLRPYSTISSHFVQLQG